MVPVSALSADASSAAALALPGPPPPGPPPPPKPWLPPRPRPHRVASAGGRARAQLLLPPAARDARRRGLVARDLGRARGGRAPPAPAGPASPASALAARGAEAVHAARAPLVEHRVAERLALLERRVERDLLARAPVAHDDAVVARLEHRVVARELVDAVVGKQPKRRERHALLLRRGDRRARVRAAREPALRGRLQLLGVLEVRAQARVAETARRSPARRLLGRLRARLSRASITDAPAPPLAPGTRPAARARASASRPERTASSAKIIVDAAHRRRGRRATAPSSSEGAARGSSARRAAVAEP